MNLASELNSLKFHSPKLFRYVLQLQANLPAAAAFVPAPHQNRIAHGLIGQVNEV